MKNFWIFFLHRRAFTYMLMLALSVAGLYALVSIPKESAPEIIIPEGIIATSLRGASAEDVEKLITDKVEDEVANLENIDKVTSSSVDDLSVVTAQFIASADVDKSIQDLKDAVDRAKVEFPKEANEPTVTRLNFADQPILIISVSADRAQGALSSLGDDVKDALKKIGGVSRVEVSGVRKKEVQIVLSSKSIEKYGLSVDAVIGAINASNVSFPIGQITVSDINYGLKFDGAIDDASAIGDIIVSTKLNTPIYLRDVAFVADGLAVPQSYSRESLHGAPSAQAITFYVYKKPGGDVTQVAKNVLAELETLKGSTLTGADVVVSFDRGALVTKDLRELTKVGLETVGLVILMLFLTIGWRESVVAALSIPLSFVIAFIGLYASGNTINFISLFSLILAIGILVDSGIVVVEAIHTRLKLYATPDEAAEASLREYALPLTAGTMTTVAVFFPLFFLSGIVGKFVASIPFTLIFVLLASIFVALGMVPLIAVIMTKEHKSRIEEIQDEYSEKARNWYKAFLGHMFDSRKIQNIFLSLMILGLVGAIALPVVGLVKVQFFPGSDEDYFYVEIEKPQGTPLAQTDHSVREVEEYLYDDPDVDSFVTTVGQSSAFGDTGPSGNSKLANITVILKKDRTKTSTEIANELRNTLSPINSAIVRVKELSGGPPSGAPITVKFLGNDLNDLGIAVDHAERLLASIPGTRDVQTSMRDDGTQFSIAIDREKASEVGLTAAQVAQTLHTAVSGAVATTIKRGQNDIDVVVKFDLNPNYVNPEDTTITTVDSIKGIPVVTPSGTVLLGSLITITPDESRAAIAHEDRKRIGTVTSQINAGANAVEITGIFKDRMGELDLPPGVDVDFGGENEDVNKSFSDMGVALLAGMALMMAILVLEFNSFRYTFYLLSIVPLSLIGVLAGLALTGQTLSFSSMLGVIALAGVIINHAIILLDSIIHLLKQQTGKPLREVIIEASSVRLRPIFLTTITTAIGMIPLAGASPLWGPLAFAIMFGLMFAMILTLILIPVLFYRWPGKKFTSIGTK